MRRVKVKVALPVTRLDNANADDFETRAEARAASSTLLVTPSRLCDYAGLGRAGAGAPVSEVRCSVCLWHCLRYYLRVS